MGKGNGCIIEKIYTCGFAKMTDCTFFTRESEIHDFCQFQNGTNTDICTNPEAIAETEGKNGKE